MTLPFAAISPSEPTDRALPACSGARARRASRSSSSAAATRLDRLFQSGAAKVRLPLVAAGEPPQAVLINTAGGLTGGDRMSAEVTLGADCRAVVTTQACEKIYRAASAAPRSARGSTVGEGARLDWLPQETILFDGARLARRLEVDLAPGAELLLVEATIFGRSARGETVRSGLFADRWRIRRQGGLIFADDLRFDWADADLLSRPAVLAGAAAMATILFVDRRPGATPRAAPRASSARPAASAPGTASSLARMAAKTGAALRQTLIPALATLRDGASLPKFWRI